MTMQPYYKDSKGITIYHSRYEDVLGLLSEKPALVLDDPPYGIDYNPGGGNGVTNKTFTSADKIVGDQEPFNPKPLLDLKTKTVLWGANNFADKLPPVTSWLVWYKKDGLPSIDYGDCEMAWSNLGMPPRVFNHVWHGMIKNSEKGERRKHPNQKPTALMRWCLTLARLAPSALVFDPHMGSGPVAQACKEMGYRYIGCDVVEQYCASAVARVSTDFRSAIAAPESDWAGTLFEVPA
jgi:site-specific DNA-methyltransferase (adenine-specific)